MSARRSGREDGSITVLIIGYTAIAAVLIVVAIDVSEVFLARRALAAAADAAALAAARGVDTRDLYAATRLGCGEPLPLDPARAGALAGRSVDDDRASLRHTFASVGPPITRVAGGTATVQLRGEVAIPFGGVMGWLDPSSGGRVGVTETSHAESPVAGAGC